MVNKLDSATFDYEIPTKTEYPAILSYDQVRGLVSKYDWDVELATKIVLCESSGRIDVVNNNPATGDYSVGLMQVNIKGSLAKDRPLEEDLKNPEKNIEFSYLLYKSGGWKNWRNCYNKNI